MYPGLRIRCVAEIDIYRILIAMFMSSCVLTTPRGLIVNAYESQKIASQSETKLLVLTRVIPSK